MRVRSSLQGLAYARRSVYKVLLAVGLIGLFLLLLRDPPIGTVAVLAEKAPQPPTGGLTPLTTGPHMDGFASWSHAGSRLVFMRDGQIWLAAADGLGAGPLVGPPTRATPGAWDVAPVWRPDDRQVAFVRLSPDGRSSRIMLGDPEAHTETVLAEVDQPVGYLAWGDRGFTLWYSTMRTLSRLDLRSKQSTAMYTAPDSQELLAGGLTLSADGRSVIFGAGERGSGGAQYDLWTLPAQPQGSKAFPQRLTQGGGIMPAVDAAGDRLLYRNPRGASGIYLMDLRSHSTRRVLADQQGGMFFHPAFAPDDRRMVVSRLEVATEQEPGMPGTAAVRLVSHLLVRPLGDLAGN